MNSLEILSKLELNLSIRSRELACKIIINEPIIASDLLNYIKSEDDRKQMLLICVLDYIIDDFPNYLNDNLNDFINFQKKITNETCKRVMSRIIYNLLKKSNITFTEIQKEELINIHFDWLISNSLVATRVNCISVLFELRSQADWISTELIGIIDQQILLQEPSFVSRAKKILTKIHKEAKR